jgi:hypothetical protein
MTTSCWSWSRVGVLLAALCGVCRGQSTFSFAPHLDLRRPPCTLNIHKVATTGRTVEVNGADSAQPARPFLFNWGDGKVTEAWFPATHTYERTDRNYELVVTARYPDRTDRATVTVRFIHPTPRFQRVVSVPRRVFVPSDAITLGSTMPGWKPPEDVAPFADADLPMFPRDEIEYLLDVAHHVQMDLCNQNVTRDAATRQVVLKQTQCGGCGSLWFTDPVSLVCHPSYLGEALDFSSLLHELAHNLTLNSPSGYRFGGKTDGPMNAIVSETLAQIFQHATIYIILNTEEHFGLSDAVCERLRANGAHSIGVVREAHRAFLANPHQCTTYNDPGTREDDTLNTFMTVAYVFCDLAEQRGDYATPLKRMMALMQTFGPSDHQRFQQRENEAFRASFLVAAVSFGFDIDLRDRFRKLNFPVSDELYTEMLARMKK